MARRVRLREFGLIIAIFPCLWAVSGGLRYGSKPSTLHTHKTMETEYMGQSVKIVNSEKFPTLSKQHQAHRRLRRDAHSHMNFSSAAELHDSNYQMIIHWAGKYSDVIVALTRDIVPDNKSNTNLYISKDYGTTFHKKNLKVNRTTPAILDRFYNSPVYNSMYIFTDVFHKVVFVTRNYVKSVYMYRVPFAPRQIAPHPKDPEILLGHDDEDPKKQLYVSMDFGANWHSIQSNVKSFYWGVDGIDQENTLFVERQEPDGTSRLLKSRTYFKNGEFEEVFGRVEDVQVIKRFILATQAIDGKNDSLRLWVSADRQPFVPADFSELGGAKVRDFFVADASEDAVLVCVTYNMTKTDLYVSDFRGERFYLSLTDVVYFNPNLQDNISWLRAFTDPFADVHRVEGLKGIYIASVEEQLSGNDNTTGLKSYITHNLGGNWFPVVPPTVDAKGRRYNCSVRSYFWPHFYHSSCSLHLAQKYHTLFPQTRAVPILSKKSAIGLIMATGVVNKSMSTDLNVYVSRDGGFVWREVMQEPHFYAFGDHGGIIVAVQQKNFTKEVRYSTDEGETWNTHWFHTEELRVYGILTEPGERTMVFSIFGSHKSNHSWIIIKLDMRHIYNVNCTSDDYKNWSPSSSGYDDCLLGRKTVYQRRISHAQCFNGQEFEREISVENCQCRIDDYECDDGFMRQHDWSMACVPDPDKKGSAHTVPRPCPAGHFYNRSKGYVKIAGDSCGGGDAYRFDPDRILCPMHESNEFMLLATSNSIKQINLPNTRSTTLLPLEHLSNVKSVEYDYQENCLYFVNGWQNAIKRNCFNGTRGMEDVVKERTENIESIALDWNTNNIFWLEVGTVKKIEVATTAHLDAEIDGNIPLHRRVIVGGANSSYLVKPKSLVVYPKYGYMFWAEQATGHPSIKRAWMDGQNVQEFVNSRSIKTMASPQGLTIDAQRELLFWVDTATYEIWFVNLATHGRSPYPQRLVSNVHALYLSVFKDEIYFPDHSHNAIMAINKYTSEGEGGQNNHVIRRTVMSNVHSVTDLKVFTVATQHGDTPCSHTNGQCSSICVERPNNLTHTMPLNRTCLCADFYATRQKDQQSNMEKCQCPDGEVAVNQTCVVAQNGTCDSGQFKCASGRCVPLSWRCDRDDDCGDFSDETDCPYFTCSSLQFACNNGRCIPAHWRCDHDADCPDGSDEGDHCVYSDCNNSTQFTCANHRCIPAKWKCDGDDDCHDGSDEEGCNTTTIHPSGSCGTKDFRCDDGRCIVRSWICDGDSDCVDDSDEKNCNVTAAPCQKWQHRCPSGECIEKLWLCDGQPDCMDGSDEKNCSFTTVAPSTSCAGSFQCLNRMCISFRERCDGINDCGDNSDEIGCEMRTCPPRHMKCGSGECLALRFQCDGTPNCEDGSDERQCSSPAPSVTCPTGQFHCYQGGIINCIPESWVCDATNDCDAGEDERHCNGTTICDETKNFKCVNGENCIPKLWLCDGDSDCDDHSDEMCEGGSGTGAAETCSEGTFSCGYGFCIDYGRVCDGHSDCPDDNDEANCAEFGVKELNVVTSTNTSIIMEWTNAVPKQKDVPYKVMGMYRTESDTHFKNTTLYNSNEHVIIFEHLSPNTTYIVSATIKQSDSTLPPVKFRRVSTEEGAPGPPELVSVAISNSTKIELIWNMPKNPNGLIRKFEIFYKDDQHSYHGTHVLRVKTPSPTYQYEVQDLPPGHKFIFWIVAWTRFASVPSNAKSLFYGKDSIMSCVQTAVVFNEKPQYTATVTLTPTKDPEELKKIDGFSLHIISEEAHFEKKVDLHKKDLTHQFDKVAPGLTYKVYAVARNAQSVGRLCDITTSTAPGTMQVFKKNSTKVDTKNENVFSISWDALDKEDQTYAVYYTSKPSLYNRRNFYTEKEVAKIETNRTFIVLSHLQACEIYVLRMQVISPYRGALGDPISFATDEDDKAPPENVEMKTWNKGEIGYLQVFWDAPCLESQYTMSYVVRLEELVDKTVVSSGGYPAHDLQPGRGLNITIHNLTRGATYQVSVVTKVEDGRYSPPKTIQIAPYPGPIDVKIELSKNSYKLTWEAPPNMEKTGPKTSYEVWQAHIDDSKSKPNFQRAVIVLSDSSYKIPMRQLKAGIYLYKVRVFNMNGGKYPSEFSETAEFYKPSEKGSHAHHSVAHSSLTLVAIIVPCSIVVLLLSAMLTVAVMRNRRLQRSFLSYANSHYDTRSGTTTFSTSDELAEEEEPMIRGFSDDEPLVMA